MKLFRNKSTNENVKKLACLAFHYEKRGYTSIGVELLHLAEIGTVSEDDVLVQTSRLKSQLKKYTDYLVEAGFLEIYSKSYQAGVFRRLYRVKKEAILEAYGQEAVEEAKAILKSKRHGERSVEAFLESLAAEEILPAEKDVAVTWEITGPGKIEFTRGKRHLRTVEFKDEYGKQRFMVSSFYGIKDAMIEFVKSIRSEVPGDDVQEKLDFINSKVSAEFQMEFCVHFTIKWNKGHKSFVTHKSTRSVSPFCGYGRKNGDRDAKLAKENMAGHFDIKSCVPRLTYFLNRGVWLDNSKDLYQVIYEASGLTREWNTKLRNHMKLAFFPLYFVEVEYRSMVAYRGSKNVKEEIPLCDRFTAEEYARLFIATREVLAGSRGPGIFHDESLVEIEVVYRILKSGRRIVNVFDGFYFGDDVTEDEVSGLVAQVVHEILKERA